MTAHSPSAGPLTTGALAAQLGGELVGPESIAITGVNSLEDAGPGALTFIRSAAFAKQWAASRASAALVSRGIEVPGHDRARRALIIVPDADLAMVKVLGRFAPAPVQSEPGVHSSAVVEAGASIDTGASIGPLCVIRAGARVGAGTVLRGSVTLERHAAVGARSVVHPGVVIGERCTVGDDCILHAGVVIGADGFGFGADSAGKGITKVPHIGNVVIGNHVEIGANSCIDRAKFGSTTLGDGTKLDNLVQVAHNCRIGKCCLICGQCALAGSVVLGDGVILAGQVGISDGVTIGAGARIGAQSGVINDIPAGQTWFGGPAMPSRDAAANYAAFRTLAQQLRELRRALKAEAAGP